MDQKDDQNRRLEHRLQSLEVRQYIYFDTFLFYRVWLKIRIACIGKILSIATRFQMRTQTRIKFIQIRTCLRMLLLTRTRLDRVAIWWCRKLVCQCLARMWVVLFQGRHLLWIQVQEVMGPRTCKYITMELHLAFTINQTRLNKDQIQPTPI